MMIIPFVTFSIFLLLVLVPVLLGFVPPKSEWSRISSRATIGKRQWQEMFAARICDQRKELLTKFLIALCQPVKVEWSKLRPEDKLGPACYRRWIFDIDSTWECILDGFSDHESEILALTQSVWRHNENVFLIEDLIDVLAKKTQVSVTDKNKVSGANGTVGGIWNKNKVSRTVSKSDTVKAESKSSE